MVAKRINVSIPEDLAEAIDRYGLSPSALMQEALRREVARREWLQNGMGDLTVEMGDEDRYIATFTGRWLVEPDPDETRPGPDEYGFDAGSYYGVAATGKGQIAVYAAHVNEGWAPSLETRPRLEDFEQEIPEAVYEAAAAALSGAVRLDI
jgi:hypothetical protein